MATVIEISRKQTVSRDGASVIRVFEIEPYASWGQMVNMLLGGVRLIGKFLYRTPPLGDPYIPWAFAKSVDVEGVGTFHGQISQVPLTQIRTKSYYRRARLTVTYETMQVTQSDMQNATNPSPNAGDIQEIELATQTVDISAKVLTMPNYYYRFRYSPNMTPGQTQNNVVKVFPEMKLVTVRHFVINEPLIAYSKLIGRVNYAQMKIGRKIWPPETMRLDGVHSSQRLTNLGLKYFEIQYTFAIQPVWDNIATSAEVLSSTDPRVVTTRSTTQKAYVGWNRIYRGDRGLWDRLISYNPVTTLNDRQLYEYDTDVTEVISGYTISGFRLLFHPGAT